MAGRTDRLAGLYAPLTRLVWGMGLIPFVVFQKEWYLTLVMAAACALLATAAGKRIKFGYFLLMVGSITAFNLLTPYGRILASLGPFKLTQGALEDGLNKGLVIVALVFISLSSVSRELRFPGHFGGLLARTIHYYEMLLHERKNIYVKSLIPSIDRLLERLFVPGQVVALPPEGPRRRTQPLGWLLLALSWLAAGGMLWLGLLQH